MRVARLVLVLLALVAALAVAGGDQEADISTDVDEEIERDVEAALRRDSRVDAEDITVFVDGGIVRLTGVADSIRERNAAVDDARGVLGVIDVIDEMDVVSDVETTTEELMELDVRRAIRSNPVVDVTGLVVDGEGAQVTLSGTVDSLYERERAAAIAADVTGVVAVINEIAVEPESARTDRQIREDVQAALIRNSIVDKEDITVLVEDGVVTLSGVVSNWVEEQEALDVAQFTSGVVSVVDQLEISSQAFDDITTRSIREQVREQLQWDVRVDDDNISVSVSDGVVTLSGTVSSAAARSAAVASAWNVAGVRDVVDRLEVATETQPDLDTALARVVENSLELDPNIEIDDLRVVEQDGVVELYGSVAEAWMVDEAEDIAENTIGVREVENNLVVVPPEARTDVEIRLDVVSSLQSDVRVDASDVEVIVDDGVVTLAGTVSSWDAWQAAYAIALQTDGVVDVESNLEVESA